MITWTKQEDGLVVPGRFTAFYNEKKMGKFLHRELERKRWQS